MSTSSPAPSSTDDDARSCHSFTLGRAIQFHPIACLTSGAWRVVFETAVIGIAASLLLGLLVAATRHKLWHRSRMLKRYLGFVSDTLYLWLSSFVILLQQLDPDSSIIWTVLLFATYGSFYSVLGCSLYGDREEAMLRHETTQLASNAIVLFLLLTEMDHGSDTTTKLLFAIWGLSILKIIGRIFSFRAAEKSYGRANTKLVAIYMKREHEQGPLLSDPSRMEGYKYLVIGEERAEAAPPSYEPQLTNIAAVTTVEDVRRCEGRLFKGSSGGRYRDMCLSFAFFKLIKMRFDDYPQVDDESKSRALIRDGLLSEDDDGKRAFEVIESELGFLRDLFHTKYPVASNRWILICNLFILAMIAVVLRSAVKIAHDKDFEHPAITEMLVGLLILAEIWELISYLFSDWGKVILICMYVKNYRPADRYHVDKILRAILWRNLSCRSLYEKLDQFSLLNSLNSCCACSRCCYSLADRLPGTLRKLNHRLRKEKPVRLKAEVKKAIFLSLKKLLASERAVLTNGVRTLKELGREDQLGWACGVGDDARTDGHSHMHTIMIWHIATALCETKLPLKKKKKGEEGLGSELESRAAVANSLSKYCAYLVTFAPQLLPIEGHSSKIMFKQVFAEACRARRPPRMCGKITYDDAVSIEDSRPTIISKGVRLGTQLMNDVKEDAERWELLESFWAELILFLAPSKNARAHASKLGEGGEFITRLWALLYHARVDERFPEKKEHAGEHV